MNFWPELGRRLRILAPEKIDPHTGWLACRYRFLTLLVAH